MSRCRSDTVASFLSSNSSSSSRLRNRGCSKRWITCVCSLPRTKMLEDKRKEARRTAREDREQMWNLNSILPKVFDIFNIFRESSKE